MVFSVRWLGHASFQIEVEGKKILIDPYEGECKDKADLVLGTHSHFDHFDPSIVRRVLKGDTLVIAPEDCANKIRGR